MRNLWSFLPFFLVLIAPAGLASAQDDTEADRLATRNDGDPAPITRFISLEELGYRAGILVAEGQTSQSISLPVPAGAQQGEMALSLSLDVSEGFDLVRTLTVQLDGTPQQVIDLSGRSGRVSADIPLRRAADAGDYTKISFILRSDNPDAICYDRRVFQQFVRVDAASGLSLSMANGAVSSIADFARLAPKDLVFVAPSRDGATLAAALNLANWLDARSLRFAAAYPQARSLRDWNETVIEIAGNAQNPGAGLSLGTGNGPPRLIVSPDAVNRHAPSFTREWAPLFLTRSVVPAGLERPAEPVSSVSFEDAGIGGARIDFVETGLWTAGFTAAAMPRGQRPSALDLMLAVSEDMTDRPVVASLYVNDTMIESARLKKGEINRLRVDIPERLLGAENSMSLSLRRQPVGGNCETAAAPFPVDILPQSAFHLAPWNGEMHFGTLAAQFADGVAVSIDAAGEDAALSLMLAAINRTVPDAAPIEVARAGEAVQRPFIHLGAEHSGLAMPADFSADALSLSLKNETVMHLGDVGAMTSVQVARASDGSRAGLWIRPGSPDRTPGRIVMGRGDILLADASGTRVTLTSFEDSGLALAAPARASIAELVLRWRVWLLVLTWVGITLLVILSLRALYRRRNEEQGTE